MRPRPGCYTLITATRMSRALRLFSTSVYGSLPSAGSRAAVSAPPAAGASAPVSLSRLDALRASRTPVVVLTAYDAPMASFATSAGVDVLLVGDSVGMVSLGHASTVPVTLDAMVHHCAAVARGSGGPLLVGDLPFGSYGSADSAVASATRLVQEGGMQMVKLEGGAAHAGRVRAVVEEGIPVMGHVGLLPQTALLGGERYALRGRRASEALRIVEDALAIQEAGARALVLEMVPWQVAAYITSLLRIPTIGIGAGPQCSGQVLVCTDALGYAPKAPSFVKRYAELGALTVEAIAAYCAEVRGGSFPRVQVHSRAMEVGEFEEFRALADTHFGRETRGLPQQQQQQQQTPEPAAPPLPQAPALSRPITSFSPAPPALKSFPKTAIVGAGAIGSLLACSLAASGHACTIYSHWSERVRHIESRGVSWLDLAPTRAGSERMQVKAPLSRVRAVDLGAPGGEGRGGASKGPYDLVFIAGSAVDADRAIPLAWSLVGEGGLLCPLYNGHFCQEYAASLAGRHARHPHQLAAGLTSAGATLHSASSAVERTGYSSTLSVFLPPAAMGGAAAGLEALAASLASCDPNTIPLAIALQPHTAWAPARLTKLLVNSILNPCMALVSGGGGALAAPSVNAEFCALSRGAFSPSGTPRGALADAAEGLCGEAAQCLAEITGAGGVAGWEGVRDGADLLELVRRVALATPRNVNSMAADFSSGRPSEVDFISGALVMHLQQPTWNHRIFAAVTARERALGIRTPAHETRIKGIWNAAVEAGGSKPLFY